jgi:hypothetical protein
MADGLGEKDGMTQGMFLAYKLHDQKSGKKTFSHCKKQFFRLFFRKIGAIWDEGPSLETFVLRKNGCIPSLRSFLSEKGPHSPF